MTRLTDESPTLDRGELATTAVAVAVSSGLYVRFGHPYLARGVLGDLLGLCALGVPLAVSRRRVRHEAAWCLAAIAAVHGAAPQWPLEIQEPAWWAAIAAALAAYSVGRHRTLR